mmetsp:Transcript_15283/g.34683  ORF Transcript_15283/g.34683 Transcript_15283/m.34683 type:complete len:318 (+) Transcript_15283:94-1047(+)|eukprot:CAMPEP_0197892426 /NCGR_PEP_ID=MMETSP1439-20131203/30290_1 /TAXON_ID=66791 /ORGANISM="Gonyaulax spinifera, Strain CCMP409" /LENGTH=317 /DNA_ID=CAMNT_0043512591 /DNA_START=88 /DNA_END=1041 /DNA_ORIENTATION=+
MAIQEALRAGDEVWEAAGSSDEEDMDSDVEPQAATPPPRSSPQPSPPAARSVPAAPAAAQQERAVPPSSMAALMGHLRCDNLKLREALVEAQREAERLAMALQQEMDERLQLKREVELLRGNAEAEKENAGGSNSNGPQLSDSICKEAIEFDGKRELEQQLVACKLRCAEAVERAESLEVMVEHYEGQLRNLSPCSQSSSPDAPRGRQPAAPHSSEASSTSPPPSGKEKHSAKHRIKKLAGRMFKPHGSHSGHVDLEVVPSPSSEGIPGTVEDMARQREVIACLMAELEKANQKIHHYKGKSSRREARKAASGAVAE